MRVTESQGVSRVMAGVSTVMSPITLESLSEDSLVHPKPKLNFCRNQPGSDKSVSSRTETGSHLGFGVSGLMRLPRAPERFGVPGRDPFSN